MNKIVGLTHKLGKMTSKIASNTLMRIFLLFIGIGLSSVYANPSYAQTKISIDAKGITYQELFDQIQGKSEFIFFYKDDVLDSEKRVFLKLKKAKLSTVLDRVFYNTDLDYSIDDRQVVIKKRDIPIKAGLSSPIPPQDFALTGTITDNQGIPLAGASVLEEGTTNGTQSDFDGNFSLALSSGNVTVVISYIGFATKKIPVDNQSTISVVLEESAAGLDEVIVVGYGTVSKKDVTGSIATISSEAIAERSTTNISNALQGSVAGLNITRGNSEPGSGNTIRIRGNTTLQGSNSPLILVDDIPVTDLNSVPADQVESISVLKDASAAAIYGSRAASGVIIVTTKRAKQGIFSASYTTEYLVNRPSEKRKLVDDPARYMELINERAWNDNGNDDNRFPIFGEDRINAYKSGLHLQDRDAYPYTDWADLILKKNSTGSRHNVNISGGSEKVKTNFSLGYEKQDALYAFRDWTRYTARINNDIKISDRLGAVADISFRLVEDDRPILDPTSGALSQAPIYNAFHQDGRLAGGRDSGNTYARLHSGSFTKRDTYNFNARLGMYYNLTDDLKVTVNFSPSFNFAKYKAFNKPQPFWGADDPDQLAEPRYISNLIFADLTESRSNTNSYTKQALLDYNKTFGKHSLKLIGGYEDFSSKTEVLGVRALEFISADFPYLNQAPTDKVFNFVYDEDDRPDGTRISEIAYVSGFGRVNYNYDSKYYLGATVRYDGSSRFGSDYRWGTFPSVSAAWTASNEPFMQSQDAISYLKFKGSYGQLGNDRLGNYLYLTVLQISNTLIDNGGTAEEVRAISQQFLTTPDIKWETTTTKNFGVEVGLLDNRLSLEGEYFVKETTDMLLSLSVPDVVGFDDPTVNVGSMNTKGWELSASWNDNIGSDFNYGLSFNISDAESIIGDIKDKRLFDDNTLSEEGHEFRELYGLQSLGIYQTQEEIDNSAVTSDAVRPGDLQYKDLSGPDGTPDGIINDFDRTFLGSSLDRYIYGGRINASYKGFDFGLSFQGVAKKNFVLARSFLFNNPEVQKLTQEYANNFWSFDNTPAQNANALYPRYSLTSDGNNFRFSDYYVKNGAYLRIKSISLGYTIPRAVFDDYALSSVRLYVSGNDLFSFHSLPDGIDPEQSSGSSYFITKSVVLGAQIKF